MNEPTILDSSGNVVPGHPSWKGDGSGGGNGGGGSELEARVATLEKAVPEIREKLLRIELRLDSIETNMATKVDLANMASKDDLNGFVRASGKDIQDLAVSFQKSLNEQTWKFIGVATALAGLAFTAAKFIG
jgi:hypothetical protein